MIDGVSREMPRYKSHKTVHALKIGSLTISIPGVVLTPANEGYAPFTLDEDYVLKHSPKVGGYYVVYEDGYKSYSPAEAFEGGYTKL